MARTSRPGASGNNDRLRVQFDEAEAGTFRLIQYVPLAIVVHVRPVGSFWAALAAGAPS
jgi:hypothetical protein